jgi:two-component system, cell cycle sensor histidine kinase and response regulator CckA
MWKKKEELQEQLNQSKKTETLGLLAGNITHDLNNILSGIVTLPELIIMDLEPDSPLQKPLHAVQSSRQQAADVVEDLLTLSRRTVATKKVLNVSEISKEYLESPKYNKLISFHPHIRVEKSLKAAAPFCYGSTTF